MTGHPLRRRLVWIVVALVFGVTAALAVVSAVALRSTLSDELDQQLELASERAATTPQGPPGSGGEHVPLGQAAGTVGVYYDDGEVVDAGYVDDAGKFQPLDAEQLAALEDLPQDGKIHTVELPGLGTFRAVTAHAPHGDAVITALSDDGITGTVGSYVTVEVALAGAGVVLAGVAATVLVRRALRPLDRVAVTARQVSELPLDSGAVGHIPRVPPALAAERGEVGAVGAAFNRMIAHVETALSARHESEQQVRRFVADASHELRTPLASIRGYAELVRRSPDEVPPAATHAIGRVESEARRMTGLVDDLLLLARLDAGRPLERAPVDLAGLAVDAIADAHAAGPDHVWRLDLGARPRPLLVDGDDARLRQVLANLLGNARVHTPAGTTVTVSGRRRGGDVVLSVADDGPGIAADQLPGLFQRFSRADTARNRTGGSTGLGLAIAEAIVHAHGGTIAAESWAPTWTFQAAASPTRERRNSREGTTFTVRLPALTAGAQVEHSPARAGSPTVAV
ncbi:sensor histidine kinase [Jiangella alkaliphila]|uniref:histidine kinase n=1 Tax=Jiangella alkaliphila TaxID=419479 RepID=A0A1H2JE52_9ACTN|nr:HAMP domain-containing sensor histidine kinase [Jiangella alkaliphila]SDU54734.1 two-component system, OmpR family, sensor kinase [Jiangella alkaliphila]